MIPFFQLDPATFALWCNVDLFSDQPDASALAEIAEAVLANDDDLAAKLVFGLPVERQPRAIAIASAFWHEKRHFLDLILTNYINRSSNIPTLLS